jgi:LysR family transcriptional regulator, transcriptional activator for aaeXAB operon
MQVSWELSVLSKAVAFSNLSSAAGPVGLSQPQLSRIVARLEQELQVVLLDRAAKRKSGWTPMAQRLAEIYLKSSSHLNEQIRRLADASEPQSLRVGALDGLASVAAELSSTLFARTQVRTIELDLYDLTQLEESFLKGELDLVFTGREPGRKKFKNVLRIGFQSLEETGRATETRVMSPFEYGVISHKTGRKAPKPREAERTLISNSLMVRRHWIETFGGRAVIPTPMRRTQSGKASEAPVLLIGHDAFSPKLWEKISAWVMIQP